MLLNRLFVIAVIGASFPIAAEAGGFCSDCGMLATQQQVAAPITFPSVNTNFMSALDELPENGSFVTSTGAQAQQNMALQAQGTQMWNGFGAFPSALPAWPFPAGNTVDANYGFENCDTPFGSELLLSSNPYCGGSMSSSDLSGVNTDNSAPAQSAVPTLRMVNSGPVTTSAAL